jgi:hypothetical protein
VNQNTRATGNWAKNKVPTFPAWPRPKPADANTAGTPRRPVTVADLYQRFQRR